MAHLSAKYWGIPVYWVVYAELVGVAIFAVYTHTRVWLPGNNERTRGREDERTREREDERTRERENERTRERENERTRERENERTRGRENEREDVTGTVKAAIYASTPSLLSGWIPVAGFVGL
jgi:hypothetical protein